MNKLTLNLQKKIMIFLFTISILTLLTCFIFLEFWYAKKDGLQNGFHIHNTSYSIFYWFSHISYLSCLIVTIWSGFELLGLYNEKYRPKFIFRFFTLFWITLTMCGEALLLPSMMAVRVSEILGIFDLSNWDDLNWWFGIDGFLYSLVDFMQFISIHLLMPIIMIFYSIVFKQKQLTNKDKWVGILMICSFMIIWYISVGIMTLNGMQGPYPILDWTPDGYNDWNLKLQLTASLLGFITFALLTFLILNDLEKKWNSIESIKINSEFITQENN